jgi:hypothetical protein
VLTGSLNAVENMQVTDTMRKGVLDISIFIGRETLLMYAQIAVLICAFALFFFSISYALQQLPAFS